MDSDLYRFGGGGEPIGGKYRRDGCLSGGIWGIRDTGDWEEGLGIAEGREGAIEDRTEQDWSRASTVLFSRLATSACATRKGVRTHQGRKRGKMRLGREEEGEGGGRQKTDSSPLHTHTPRFKGKKEPRSVEQLGERRGEENAKQHKYHQPFDSQGSTRPTNADRLLQILAVIPGGTDLTIPECWTKASWPQSQFGYEESRFMDPLSRIQTAGSCLIECRNELGSPLSLRNGSGSGRPRTSPRIPPFDFHDSIDSLVLPLLLLKLSEFLAPVVIATDRFR